MGAGGGGHRGCGEAGGGMWEVGEVGGGGGGKWKAGGGPCEVGNRRVAVDRWKSYR